MEPSGFINFSLQYIDLLLCINVLFIFPYSFKNIRFCVAKRDKKRNYQSRRTLDKNTSLNQLRFQSQSTLGTWDTRNAGNIIGDIGLKFFFI
ncbi:hypothetical protein FC81_GL002049 [Liquorilactobacillus capillatus DSM 19910]|uniref:Uncharacterized protein n=1 Tax=Liquorilactobacillus capillatus DSM 19910 TaxID=1423731 RepID=A0A0R1M5U6_9LACO|nr:hypothetical protein FC81_GL002049 [Liquorilactobacillus capillatus DSM 19910]